MESWKPVEKLVGSLSVQQLMQQFIPPPPKKIDGGRGFLGRAPKKALIIAAVSHAKYFLGSEAPKDFLPLTVREYMND